MPLLIVNNNTPFMIDEEIREDLRYINDKVTTIFKHLDWKGCIATLSNSKLLFNNPTSFNDPYDCYKGLINFDNIPETYRQHIISRFSHILKTSSKVVLEELNKTPNEEISRMFKDKLFPKEMSDLGITCFSEDFKNLLMWSHYSDSHKGVCVGFDLRQLYTYLKGKEPALIKVKYTDKLEQIDYFVEPKKAFINCFRTRSRLWKYEKEIRIVLFQLAVDQTKKTLIPFGKEVITQIIIRK